MVWVRIKNVNPHHLSSLRVCDDDARGRSGAVRDLRDNRRRGVANHFRVMVNLRSFEVPPGPVARTFAMVLFFVPRRTGNFQAAAVPLAFLKPPLPALY